MARRTKTARMVTIVLIALLVGLMFSVYPERAHACMCVTPPSHEYLVSHSEVIFLGRLVDTRTYTQGTYSDDDSPFVDFKFEVESVWKGIVPQVAYLAAMAGALPACPELPADFVVGMRYLIYTYESMEISLCTPVFQEGVEYRDLYFLESIGTFEEQVANLGPAGAFSGTGADGWPPTATPYPSVSNPGPPTPTSPPAVPTPAPSAGGCGRADSVDLAVIGMLAGLAWFAGRRRRF